VSADSLFEVPAAVEGGREGDATLSPDRCYRYDLWRVWDASKARCGWVMLNPPTADEVRLDATLRRVKTFSTDWGYGGFVVRNLFALRATDPRELLVADDPVGPDNDEWLTGRWDGVGRVVVGWGTGRYPRLGDRWRHVAALLAPMQPLCLRLAKDGMPVHPLYQRADVVPHVWLEAAA